MFNTTQPNWFSPTNTTQQNPEAQSGASGSGLNSQTKKSFNCSICYDSLDEIYMFLNCGHLPFCDSCCKQIMKVKEANWPISCEKIYEHN